MGQGLRHNRAFWEKTVHAFEQSGDTHAAFAQRRGVRIAALRHWLYKLRRERTAPRPIAAPVRLVPVTVTEVVSASLVEVGVAGAVLRFAAGTDARYVAQLVAALREAH